MERAEQAQRTREWWEVKATWAEGRVGPGRGVRGGRAMTERLGGWGTRGPRVGPSKGSRGRS